MKNLFKARIAPVLGFIALIAVIGFSMIGCKDDDEDGGEGGTFTVTGIPSEYNGKYAYFEGVNDEVVIWGSHEDGHPVQITNGNINIPMWLGYDTSVRYSGNHTVEGGLSITIAADNYNYIYRLWESITFSNGSATKTWSSGH